MVTLLIIGTIALVVVLIVKLVLYRNNVRQFEYHQIAGSIGCKVSEIDEVIRQSTSSGGLLAIVNGQYVLKRRRIGIVPYGVWQLVGEITPPSKQSAPEEVR